MKITDWINDGYISLRHHVGKDVDLALRNVPKVARASPDDKGFGPGFDDLGEEEPEMKDLGGKEDTVGDLNCATMWPGETGEAERGIPGWAFIWPTLISTPGAPPPEDSPVAPLKTTDKSLEVGAAGTVSKGTPNKTRPVKSKDWNLDDRYKEKEVSLFPKLKAFPKKFPGLVVAASEERRQDDLFFPSGGILVAPHLGGRKEFGSLVFDVDENDELDPKRNAYLQSLVRVYEVPKSCAQGVFGKVGDHGLALQLGKPREGFPGLGMFADENTGNGAGGLTISAGGGGKRTQTISPLSYRASGPLHPGYGASDIHTLGSNKDGDQFSAGGIWHGAYFIRSPSETGPIAFGGNWKQGRDFPIDMNVYLEWDPMYPHGFVCGTRFGAWRLRGTVPLYVPPPPYKPGNPPGTPPPPTPENPPWDGPDPGGPEPEDPHTPWNPGNPPVTPENPPGNPPDDGPGGGYTEEDLEEFFREKIGSEPVPDDIPYVEDNGVYSEEQFYQNFWEQYNAVEKLSEDPRKTIEQQQADEWNEARQNPTSLGVMASWMELVAPAFLVRPNNLDVAAVDIRNQPHPTKEQLATLDRSPVTVRIEGSGNQNAGGWNYTLQPGVGRYVGGTATGTMWVTQPEYGLEHYYAGTAPNKTSDSGFGLAGNTRLSFGTPLKNGLNGDGVNIRLSGGNLVIETTDSAGAVTGSDVIGSGGGPVSGDLSGTVPGAITVTSVGGASAASIASAAALQLTSDQFDAVNAAALPSAANPFATMADVGGGAATAIDSGLLAARPAAASVGQVYVNTNKNGHLYVVIDDAIAWFRVPFADLAGEVVSATWDFTAAPSFSNGVVPFSVTSTTMVTNLNAQKWAGVTGATPGAADRIACSTSTSAMTWRSLATSDFTLSGGIFTVSKLNNRTVSDTGVGDGKIFIYRTSGSAWTPSNPEFQDGSFGIYDSSTSNIARFVADNVTGTKSFTFPNVNGTLVTSANPESICGGSMAAGDLFYASSTTAIGKINASGTNRTVLTTSGSGAPFWEAPTTWVDNAFGNSNAGMLYRNGSNVWTVLAGGTDYRELSTVSGYPAWVGGVQAKTAGYTVLVSDHKRTFTNEGAGAREDFVLPSAAAGIQVTFYVQAAVGIRVTADTGDTIRIAGNVSAAAGRIDSTTVGDSVTLKAINATEWVAIALVGAGWSVT